MYLRERVNKRVHKLGEGQRERNRLPTEQGA